MFAKIARLESTFHALLPPRRLSGPPGKDLMDAARAWSEQVWRLSGDLGPLALRPEQLRQGLELARRPVFICGVHRSGTTLARDLLDGHPGLVVLPAEGSFRTNLAVPLKNMSDEQGACFLATEWLRRLANPINQAPYWLLGRSSPESSPYVDFARAFRAWYPVMKAHFRSRTTLWPHLAVVLAYAGSSAGPAARYWVDKTPAHERYLQEIWQEMPGAKVLHLVRAPVDVFLSRKKMEPAVHLRTCLQDLARSYRIAANQGRLNPDNYLLLHYEALCQDPSAALPAIAAFLEIEPLPCLYRPTVGGMPAQANSSFDPHLPAGSILPSRVYRHDARDLPKRDTQLLSAYLFGPASQLGYALPPIGWFARWLVQLRLRVQDGLRTGVRLTRLYQQRLSGSR